MPSSSTNQQVQKLAAENKRLRADNKKLKEQLMSDGTTTRSMGGGLRKVGTVLCLSLAVALLVAGNLLFWTGNTLTKTDRYVAATAPIIKNDEVQKAIATNATQKLFAQVDVTEFTEQSLPPRAAFLAPTIADQLQNHTQQTIEKILARPQFQDRWNTAQERSHARFIRVVGEHGDDGSLDLSEVYQDISGQLKDTKLSFLADKQLPAKVGSVELVSGSWLSATENVINNIDTWRYMAIGLLILLSAAGIWLSRNRRKTMGILGSFFAAGMFLTLISVRLGREVIASKVDPSYSEAVRQTYSIVVHGLVVQTALLLCLALIMLFIAWTSGTSASSKRMKRTIDQLLSGKLHSAVFSRENGFTTWVGRHKQTLQWLVVVGTALAGLLVRLTPSVLFTQVIVILLLVLFIEALAAPTAKKPAR